ncbi:MAG: Ig-like domain-containing protein, partial [Bacteroidales bacterium]|nr:Ig-like domain-containing protein [Bacteroidales bacterium]
MKKLLHLLTTTLVALTLLLWGNAGFAQGTEDFENLPTDSQSSYKAWTWTGTDGVEWNAAGARTDQTINGTAICWGNSGERNVVSPTYAGGMGVLQFDYVRGFTGTKARSLEVWVNGVLKSTLTVSSTSDDVISYSEIINIEGDVVLEIKSTGAAQVKLDNIFWTGYETGADTQAPLATFTPANAATDVPLNINPTITFNEPIYTSPAGVLVDNTNVESLITFPAAFSATIADNTITVVPAADLEYETDYTLTVAAVQDEAANAMEAPVTAAGAGGDGDVLPVGEHHVQVAARH